MIEDWVQELRAGETLVFERKLSWSDRIDQGKEAVRDIVGKVWVYVVAGIAVGAFIHGYAPEDFMASIMGKDAWWSVPAAVVVGIPMYSNAAGIVQVVEALLGTGAPLGTVLAFMMSVIALSLPELNIRRRVKPKLIAVCVLVVGSGSKRSRSPFRNNRLLFTMRVGIMTRLSWSPKNLKVAKKNAGSDSHLAEIYGLAVSTAP